MRRGNDEANWQVWTIYDKTFRGNCLYKDREAFIGFAEEIGYEPKLLKAVDEINKRIKRDRLGNR